MLALMRAFLLPILPLALVAACGPSKHQRLVSSAQKAEKQEQWVVAANEYGKACRLDPAQLAICQRAQEMRDYAVEIRSYRAMGLCNAGQLSACIGEIEAVREFRTTKYPKIAAVLDRAGNLALQQCKTEESTSLSQSVGALSCLQGWRKPLWDDSNFKGKYIVQSREIASGFLGLALKESPSNPGAKMSYNLAAACVAPVESQAQADMVTARQAFARNSQTQLVAKSSGGLTIPCQEFANASGRGLNCGASAHHQMELQLRTGSQAPRWQHTYVDSRHSKRYLYGTREVENPAYDRARVEYRMAEERVKSAEEDVRDKEYQCRQSEENSDCQAEESARRDLNSKEQARDTASDRFHAESPTITEDVYRDHEYTVRNHRWAAPFEARIQAGASNSIAARVEVVHTDAEQSGFSPANIPSDPVEPPSEYLFAERTRAWLKSKVTQTISGEMDRRAQNLVAQCPSGSAVECWATSHYWRGQTDFGIALLRSTIQSPSFQCTAEIL